MRSNWKEWTGSLTSLGIALGGSFFVAGLLLLAFGEDPFHCYYLMFQHAWMSSLGWASILYHMTLLTFVGLAVAVPFRAGLFNIGAEGQLVMGALFCVWAAFQVGSFPRWIAIPWCLSMGALGGALWALIPGLLKTKRGVHEVIGTLLTNLCALALVHYLTTGPWKDPGADGFLQMNPQTRIIPETCFLPSFTDLWPGILGKRSHPLNVSLFLALLMTLAVSLLLNRTRLGLLWKAMGKNKDCADLAGANRERLTLLCFGLAGALAGLVCSSEILGHRHRLLDHFSAGLGFQGIAVALLAKNNPLWIPVSAMMLAGLQRGSAVLDIRTGAPKEIGLVLQAILLFFLILADRRRKERT